MSAGVPGPVPAAERLAHLDVLRGFALFGVLLANMVPWYSGRAFLPRAEVQAMTTRADEIAAVVLGIFIHGRFQTLLAMLFGLGFGMQLARAEARGASGATPYARRMAALFALGWCHVLLLWWGDVVWGYAIVGMLLLLFRRRSPRALLIWAAILTIVPRLVTMVPAVGERLDLLRPRDYPAFKAQVLEALRGHDRLLLARRQAEFALAFSAPIVASYFPWLLGRYLIGHAAAERGILRDPAAHLGFFRRLLGLGAALGLGGSAVMAVMVARQRQGWKPALGLEMALTVLEETGTLAMACAYAAAIVLLMERPAWRRALSALAPMGQMALSAYFLQSLFCTAIFYGWGLGLLGKVGVAWCIPLSLVIYAAEVIICRAWLRRFRFGPVEWVWRSLTYGRAQGMRAR